LQLPTLHALTAETTRNDSWTCANFWTQCGQFSLGRFEREDWTDFLSNLT